MGSAFRKLTRSKKRRLLTVFKLFDRTSEDAFLVFVFLVTVTTFVVIYVSYPAYPPYIDVIKQMRSRSKYLPTDFNSFWTHKPEPYKDKIELTERQLIASSTQAANIDRVTDNATIDENKVDIGTIKYIYAVSRDPETVGKKEVGKDDIWFTNHCHSNQRCLLTTDKDFLGKDNIDKFDALMFNVRFFKTDLAASAVVPEKRHPSQRYIMHTHESPRADLHPRFINDKYLSRDFYNWTMTYRTDSDILESYGYVVVKKGYTPPIQNYRRKVVPNPAVNMTLKTKTAFWMVSHCDTINKREEYVKKLQTYIDVDVYGSCNNVECDRNGGPANCFFSKSLEYRFYLAFENSNCPDYITEKFWRTLFNPIVPIVMGGGNYKRDAPPHSYIDVNDFSTVKRLANHLNFLTEHPEKYLEYFKWKEDLDLYQYDPWCDLCRKLHDPKEPAKTYHNMTQWFYYDDNDKLVCKDASQSPYYKAIHQ